MVKLSSHHYHDGLLVWASTFSLNITNQGNQLLNLENILQIIWRYASIEKSCTIFWRICIILRIKVGRGALNEESKAKYRLISNSFVPIQWTKYTWSDWYLETVNKLQDIENLAHMLSSTEWNVYNSHYQMWCFIIYIHITAPSCLH